jgi:hypothetical protein
MSTFYSAAGEDAALSGGLATAGTWISLHSASPGTTGANEISGGAYARQQTTWGAPGGGSMAGSQVTMPVPASTTITHFGIWSASSGGTYIGGDSLPTQETYNGAGTYLLTPTQTATG